MLMPSFLRPYARTDYALLQLVTGRRTPRFAIKTRVVASRLDRQSARAIECLAHAIEYLEDTKPLSAEVTPRSKAMEDAIALLTARNRDVFFSSSAGTGSRAIHAWTGTLTTDHDHHTEWTNC